MLTTHAVGIDLGTTYSCIAYLNEHGEPVTLPNQEGELSTPSVVMFDGEEVVVGTEALRNSIIQPDNVVQNAKRFVGDPNKKWTIGGKPYTPLHISTFILKKLISAAQEQIGTIEQAVITVPAQFSDAQRQQTVEAGLRAGLQQVDVINEPVAAALCHVLGSEGLWFTELADEQRIMVYDLGGGTFDLSLVRYQKNEVSVIAGSGDLNLGGIDWNSALVKAACDRFSKDTGEDPRVDPESLQFVALEAEQTKRSLSVRPKAAMTVHHGGHRKTYQIEQELFERLTKGLVDRTEEITKRMLKDHKLGWAHVDVVLTTGGSSRMPMIRKRLKKLSGRTLNTSLSPDQSIAHGATYYAGMLLTNNKFARSILNDEASERLSKIRQKSVNARALGLLVRDPKKNERVPHYILESNTPLPTSITQNFGTVKPNQRRVNLQIIESGAMPEDPHVKIGNCVIDELPPDLPVDSEIAVTIRYDEQARIHVSAKDVASGKEAHTEIIRAENVVNQLQKPGDEADAKVMGDPKQSARRKMPDIKPKQPARAEAPRQRKEASGGPKVRAVPSPVDPMDDADEPIPLCEKCGEALTRNGECLACGHGSDATTRKRTRKKKRRKAPREATRTQDGSARANGGPTKKRPSLPDLDESQVLELDAPPPKARKRRKSSGEDEFWEYSDRSTD